MLSCVSKWLRERSSVPANGTKASWRCWYSGSIDSASAGCRPRSGDGDVRARLVVVAAGRGHKQAGAVITTAQEHKQKTHVLRAGGCHRAGAVHAEGAGAQGLKKVSASHGDFLSRA